MIRVIASCVAPAATFVSVAVHERSVSCDHRRGIADSRNRPDATWTTRYQGRISVREDRETMDNLYEEKEGPSEIPESSSTAASSRRNLLASRFRRHRRYRRRRRRRPRPTRLSSFFRTGSPFVTIVDEVFNVVAKRRAR